MQKSQPIICTSRPNLSVMSSFQ